MQSDKIIKVDQNVLLQWIYDDSNLIDEDYKILVPDGSFVTTFSYFQANLTAGIPSVTNNLQANKVFKIDAIANRYAKVDTLKYPFLHIQDFPAPQPTRFDKLKIFFPINYTFENKIGIYVRVYTMDYQNLNQIDLANFYFDKTDTTMSNLIDLASPAIFFQEKLWGKYIQLQLPSVYEIAKQRIGAVPTAGSINANLTGGLGSNGLSLTSPIFIDVSFIELKETVLGNTTFVMSKPVAASVPQTPDFQNVSLTIQESSNGDFFEIFGTVNNSNEDFSAYIESLNFVGQNIYLIYAITKFEENVPIDTQEYYINKDYSKIVIHRPVIISSNTTAALQVELKIINAVDNTMVSKTATYGMLREQISKYSAHLTRINVKNVFKPKIYNLKGEGVISNQTALIGQQKVIQKIDVPYPVMYDRANVVAKELTETTGRGVRYAGIGKMQIKIYPFDNLFKFFIAQQVVANAPQAFDLSQMNDIKLVIKSQTQNVECGLFFDSGEVNLGGGVVVFKMSEKQSDTSRSIYAEGNAVFYITAVTRNNIKTVIYSGSFIPFESRPNQNQIENDIRASLESVQLTLNAFTPVVQTLKTNVVSNKSTSSVTIRPASNNS